VLRLTAREGRATSRLASAAPTYARHAPERTLLYALVQAHYPDFIARLAAEDRSLPEYVREEFGRSCAAACSTTASCAWCASSAMRTNSSGTNLNSRRLARRA